MDWARQLGGANGLAVPYDVAPTGDGGTVVVGIFSGTVDLDPGPSLHNVTAMGATDAFVIRMDSLGNRQWLRTLGEANGDTATAGQVDALGNIVVGGIFTGNMDFDPGAGTHVLGGGSKGGFCLKLDANGDFIWAVSTVGTASYAFGPFAMDLDPQGNAYLSGNIDGSYDFDPLTAAGSVITAARRGYLWKVSADGHHVWVRILDGASSIAFGMDVDGQGNVHLTGMFSGTVDFDPGAGTTLRTAGGDDSDAYVAKYDSAGALLWVDHFLNQPATFWTYGSDVAVDGSGAVYVAGLGYHDVDFDVSPGGSAYISQLPGSRTESFLVKLDANGGFRALTALEGPVGNGAGMSLSLLDDHLVWTTRLGQWADLDHGAGMDSITLADESMIVMGLDTAFQHEWGEPVLGVDAWTTAQSMAVDAAHNIFFVGSFVSTIETSPRDHDDSLTASGVWDGFMIRWHRDTCQGALAVIDNESPVGCGSNGTVVAHMEGGNPPFAYMWNTVPQSTSPMASISQPGVYSLVVTDAIGCVRTRTIVVGGPTTLTGHDYACAMALPALRPGAVVDVPVHAWNNGCVSDTGEVRVTFDPLLHYVSSSIPPDNIVGNTLVWNHDDLAWPGPEFVSSLRFVVDTQAVIGDVPCIDMEVTPVVGDPDPANNSLHWCGALLNSFDPNDLQVQPRGVCDDRQVLADEPLVYTIRFQNTGNAEAIDIHIVDSLGPYIDMGSVKVLAKSHSPMITEVLPGNLLDFRFDGIHLPDSNADEPASHGYVVFEVRPLPGLSLGTEVRNRAGIYFDFNAPVATNAVSNTLVDSLVELDASFQVSNGVLLANGSNVNFQWMSCQPTMAPIPGDTFGYIIVYFPGFYALQVSRGGCVLTSPCVHVNAVSAPEGQEALGLRCYPNPSRDGWFHIEAVVGRVVQVQVVDMQGRVLDAHAARLDQGHSLRLPDTRGLYMVRVISGTQSLGNFKVVRE